MSNLDRVPVPTRMTGEDVLQEAGKIKNTSFDKKTKYVKSYDNP